MSDSARNEYRPSEVSPPGVTLAELLEEKGLSQAQLAQRMGRPKKTVNEIVRGKASITPETALELELVTGVPAHFWNARERDYRAYMARAAQEAQLAQQAAWARAFPVAHLVERGWIQKPTSRTARVKSLLEFFGVASSHQWDALYQEHEVAFRKSAAFESEPHALSAWLRIGVLRARELDCAPYERNKFLSTLLEVRALTREAPEIWEPAVIERCASAGVAVVFVPQLPKARVSGATRWLSSDKALIQLSLRYRTNDHLWFTFFHEAAHILLHGKRLIFLETTQHVGDLEQEANNWAANFLIPPDKYASIHAVANYSEPNIAFFAENIDIAPGIVVGRLQHDGRIPHSHLNHLKQRLQWASIVDGDPAA